MSGFSSDSGRALRLKSLGCRLTAGRTKLIVQRGDGVLDSDRGIVGLGSAVGLSAADREEINYGGRPLTRPRADGVCIARR